MISHSKKCIYIHIPKTGGYSVCKALNKPLEIGHRFLEDYPKENTANYFKFAFVRNPWDRFVSAYFYLKEGGRNLGHDRHGQQIVNRFSDFRSFVANFHSVKKDFKSLHFLPQVNWTHDKQGNMQLDFVGRYENFQDDFNKVCKILDIPNLKIPHWNVSAHNEYRQYYDKITERIIAEEYSQDIEWFDYSFNRGAAIKKRDLIDACNDKAFNWFQRLKFLLEKSPFFRAL